MGRLRANKRSFSTSFSSTTRFLKIIWCRRSMLLSICLGFAANLHLIVPRWVGHPAIRNNQYSRDAGDGIERPAAAYWIAL
jgi:hypothetical protein